MSFDDDNGHDDDDFDRARSEPSNFTWRDRERILRLSIELRGVKTTLQNLDRQLSTHVTTEQFRTLERKVSSMEHAFVPIARYRPVELLIYGFVTLVLSGVIIAFIATIIPAFKAAI